MRKVRTISAIALVFTFVSLAGASPAFANNPNVVVQWNEILQTLFPGTGPGLQLRALPMMHIAMFDAINSIEGTYTPYLTRVRGSRGGSAEAAAATAARDVLAALYPAQQATFDRLLAAQLAGIPAWRAQEGAAT